MLPEPATMILPTPRSAASSIVRSTATVYRPVGASTGGTLQVNPAFTLAFAALGLDSPAGFLDLPGEVVSGHPDRHVVRVCLSGFATAFYLKRQHVVRWREKWRNWTAAFGWVSRCEREAAILAQLAAAGLPCPRGAAVGSDGRGRSFLLVEEVPGAIDLRQYLCDTALSPQEKASLARELGRLIAAYHDAGFTTPELSAKHVLVLPQTRELVLIDWQSARCVATVKLADRVRALAALHASLATILATPSERVRVLRKAIGTHGAADSPRVRFSDVVRRVLVESGRIAGRRSIRDQRQATSPASQRLVWLVGEAVCAVPEIAATWPSPAEAAPFYGREPGSFSIRLGDGRAAMLLRGRSYTPFSRLYAWVRGRPWRSPGATLGRVLFHLERYGIPAPALFAFGQRLTGRASADWFALYTPPAAPIANTIDPDVARQIGARLRQLHDAGCRVLGNPLAAFGIREGTVSVRDVLCIRIARPNAVCELQRLLAALPPAVRYAAGMGYSQRNLP